MVTITINIDTKDWPNFARVAFSAMHILCETDDGSHSVGSPEESCWWTFYLHADSWWTLKAFLSLMDIAFVPFDIVDLVARGMGYKTRFEIANIAGDRKPYISLESDTWITGAI